MNISAAQQPSDIGRQLDREQLTALLRWNVASRDRRLAASPRITSLSSFVGYQYRRWQHRIMRLDSACREALAVLWRQLGPEAVEALFDRPLLTLDRVALTEITRSAFWRDVLLPLDRPTEVAPFFDVEFYMRQHPPVELRRLTPLAHYVLVGAGEGRKPHPFFDTTWYLTRNLDIVSSGANPLQHFVNQGYEGKRPHPAIPDTWYRSAYDSPRRNEPVAQAALRPLPIPQRRYAIHDLTRAHAATPGPRRPVVCISHVLPSRPRAGNEYRISRMLDWLAASGHELVVVVAPLEIDEPDAAERQVFFQKYQNAVICCRSGTVFASSGPLRFSLAALQQQRIGDVVAQLASDKSDETCNGLETNFCHEALIGVIGTLAKQIPNAIYYINYAFMTRFLTYVSGAPTSFVDTHDIFSDKSEKVVAFGIQDSTAVLPAEERRMLERGSAIVAIHRDDAVKLAALVPNRPILTAGVDFIAPDVGVRPDQPTILVVANNNALNLKGIRDFLRFAWPSIKAARSGAQFVVVGSVAQSLRYPDPQVRLAGVVDDLAPYYRDARVVINPSVAGTGLKIKTAESIAHARPIVSFPNGVEGFASPLLDLCHVATNWYEFGQRVILLLNTDRGIPPSPDVLQAIKKYLEPEKVYAELNAWFAELDRQAAA